MLDYTDNAASPVMASSGRRIREAPLWVPSP